MLLNPFGFDPDKIPVGYVRFVRVTATVGALVFAALATYSYVFAQRALAEKVTDLLAMLLLLKFFFFFALCGVCAAMALVLAWISLRCWLAA